jgi:peptidoglycan biosynthesis protein MviN/MurJ (putative lipid II flippase)
MHTTDQLMVLERRIGMLARVDVVEIVLCAGLSLAGLLLEGVQGAVVGQALGSLATLGLSMWLARRHLGFVWPWFATAKIVAATVVMLLALYLLHASHDALGLGLACAVGTLTYGLACAVCFAPDLKRMLRARYS